LITGIFMTFSRRKFLTRLSATSVLLPTVYFGQREVRQFFNDKDETLITPNEAIVEPATLKGNLLANRLRGIWDIEFIGLNLEGLPSKSVELIIDIGATGRSIRGYVGLPETLRSGDEPEYRLIGDIVNEKYEKVRWRLYKSSTLAAAPSYDFTALLDEVWGDWGRAGDSTLSGQFRSFDRPLLLPSQNSQFIARKRKFPLAREKITFNREFNDWLISPQHRLFHQLWHAVRDKWHDLTTEKRDALRRLNWQPGPLHQERDARGKNKHSNGSGEDFLFMHRDMLHKARLLQFDLKGWQQLPLPAPFIERDLPGFIHYYENSDGFSVPPAWESEDDDEYSLWLSEVKGSNTFYSNYQVWESQYQDPEYLAGLTLAELGSEMELGMHDWLHMRWATITRDPTNNMPIAWDRWPTDFSSRWFLAENDYLGDPFSSHVNPVFWMFHCWIDDRIEDWFRAHQWFHPGEVKRKTVNGTAWFAEGKWVEVELPWLGPTGYGCLPVGVNNKTKNLDVEAMKLALRIAFSEEGDDISPLLRRVPRRPWYARHMAVNKSGI
jgi:hypothetical protein